MTENLLLLKVLLEFYIGKSTDICVQYQKWYIMINKKIQQLMNTYHSKFKTKPGDVKTSTDVFILN